MATLVEVLFEHVASTTTAQGSYWSRKCKCGFEAKVMFNECVLGETPDNLIEWKLAEHVEERLKGVLDDLMDDAYVDGTLA